jgi:hypothetical protein
MKGDNEDSRVKQRDSAKDSGVVDITKSDNTSKDIFDITDTPDVAVWNKSVQEKNNIVKHSKERENEEAQTIGIGLRRKQRKDNDDNKDSNSTIIDPANQNDIDDVVGSGDTLTDKA